MLPQHENELLTRVGPGTAMGALMRRYWIPAAFTAQIAKPDGPPLRVRLLGENLVLFRDTGGRVGLVDEKCPHRTASLFYGRNEEHGLRCVYHGIKFDVDGNCVDLPCVPQMSDAHRANAQKQLAVKSYPCIERGDVVWTYMGPVEHKPEFPELEWTLIAGCAALFNATHPGVQLAAGARRRLRCHAFDVSCMAPRAIPAAASSPRSMKSFRPISASWLAPAANAATVIVMWNMNVMLIALPQDHLVDPARRARLGADRR